MFGCSDVRKRKFGKYIQVFYRSSSRKSFKCYNKWSLKANNKSRTPWTGTSPDTVYWYNGNQDIVQVSADVPILAHLYVRPGSPVLLLRSSVVFTWVKCRRWSVIYSPWIRNKVYGFLRILLWFEKTVNFPSYFESSIFRKYVGFGDFSLMRR